MYVYIYSKIDRLWVVGFFDPGGIWHPESDWSTSDDAAKRVHYLNGKNNSESAPASHPQPPAVFTIKQFAARNPVFTVPALLNIRFKSRPRQSSRGPIATNGAENAFITVGRKVLIDEQAFFAWVRQHRQDEL